MSSQEQPTLLITTSILDSYAWYRKCPPNWRKNAYSSLVSTIRREKYTPHKTAQRGIDFEDAIYRSAVGSAGAGSEKFNHVVEKVKRGRYQVTLKKNIEVEGRNILLFGKADVVFKNRIVDIKTTENYRGDDKYLSGWQHKLYLLMSELYDFKYLVTLFDKFPSNTIIGTYEVDYYNTNHQELLEDVKAGIWDFYEWLMSEELFYDYETIFSNSRRKR